jgi:hypothetical protein
MIKHCLLRPLLQLRLSLGLRHDRGEARGLDNHLTMHSHRDRANKRLCD